MSENIHITGASPDECWPLIRDYHYSRRMPSNIQHCYAFRKEGGLFGDSGEPIAAIIFSIPPTRWSEDVLELSRLVRSPSCNLPLTALISKTYSWLRRSDWCLLVSFADWTQHHHGGIYQAASWNFAGQRERQMDGVVVDGRFVPGRSANSRWGTRSPSRLAALGVDAEPHYDEGKFLYWKPLNRAGKAKARRLGLECQTYPKPDANIKLGDTA